MIYEYNELDGGMWRLVGIQQSERDREREEERKP